MTVDPAPTEYDILPVLARRFSPYAFEPRGVDADQLWTCLEAARWAASSYNEQPWSFIVARREDGAEFQQMLECLVEANQAWAKNAGVLLLTVVCRTFQKNGKPNRVAEHDIGLAAGNFTIQATQLGLHVHQMAGVNLSKARQAYEIPATHEPYTAIALGHAAQPDQAPAELAERDRQRRGRKQLEEFVFAGKWNQPAPRTDRGKVTS